MSRRQQGFSLVELLIVVVLLGILTLMTMPRIERALAYRDVAAAKGEVSTLFLRAKATAVQTRRPVTLEFREVRAWMWYPQVGGGTRLVASAEYATLYGVATRRTGNSITIQPTGLVSAGTPLTLWIEKSGVVDSVMFTGYGRLE